MDQRTKRHTSCQLILLRRPWRAIVASRLNRGGDLAIVQRQEHNANRLQPVMKPSTFEYQLDVLKTNTSTSIIIINLYRPSSPWIASQPFFNEPADLGQHAADVIKPGCRCMRRSQLLWRRPILATVFDLLNMKHVHSPTRDDRLLDIPACSDDQIIHDVIVNNAGNVSDHRLIKAKFYVSKRWTPVTYII